MTIEPYDLQGLLFRLASSKESHEAPGYRLIEVRWACAVSGELIVRSNRTLAIEVSRYCDSKRTKLSKNHGDSPGVREAMREHI